MVAHSFNYWLHQQIGRNDSVGDIARDIRLDRCWPSQATTKKHYLSHLMYQHQAIPSALAAFEKAYHEWERQQKAMTNLLTND